MGVLLLIVSELSATEPAKYNRGVVIRFEGDILPGLQSYLYRKLDAAKEQGADLVILEIDSPGGLLKESLEIAKHLQEVEWAHTVAYVPQKAISGAAIVALGCDEIVMAPFAQIGDAGAIFMNEHSVFQFVPEKAISYLAPALRSLAEAKGRPPALAEAMADKDLQVFHVRDLKTGQETYISEREFNAKPDDWKKLGVVSASGKGRFLALTAPQAVEVKLANAIIDNREELAQSIRGVRIAQ